MSVLEGMCLCEFRSCMCECVRVRVRTCVRVCVLACGYVPARMNMSICECICLHF